MRKYRTLTTKLLLTGIAFLLVAMASISLTMWIAWQLEGSAAAVNEAGRLRMHTLRMALALQHESPDALAQRVQQFDASVELLRTGEPTRPLYVPWSEATRTRFEAVRAGWRQVRSQWMQRSRPDAAAVLAQADDFVLRMNDFVDAIEVEIMRWTAALHLLQLLLVAVAIAAAVAFMAISYWVVLSPVALLQQALERIRHGELGTRLQVQSSDEFGQLASGFNLMASALQASHADLEAKVRDKTAGFELKNQRLAALYEVSARASEANNLEALAQGFVRQVRSITGADAAVVRWSDEGNERYVILATDGLPQAMAEAEQCLPAGSCFCGQTLPQTLSPSPLPLPSLALRSAKARVIPIAPSTSMVLPHCHEAGYQTLIALPVQIHQRVLGELDLLFRAQIELTPDMRELLEAMVRHLASSMEGLRAAALEREAAVAEERSLLARELHDSIAQSLAFLKIQTQLLRDAIAKNNPSARERSMAELDVGVRECYADVRELLVHFRTRTSAEDIEAALRTTLSKFEHQTAIATHLSMLGHGLPLAPDVQIQVLHIVQEALSNVRKHAHARSVQVRAFRHPHWRIEVQDDGVGFDPAPTALDSLHVGLGIIHERAAGIGAAVSVQSAPGRGTTVSIDLAPLVAENAAPAPLLH
ncbi:MAG: type IV pili methyl-accepting chemotaxis transducer N-terminal domain-containing protein [Giesbergeria sp.]|nr:type IV pili methyl-accepting chemotaxis transducer N-terminal domain-containing protein [Giesbergeria sp.]